MSLHPQWIFVDKKNWPTWTGDAVETVVRNKKGHYLLGGEYPKHVLWELRDAAGNVVTTLMEFKFNKGLGGAPLAWADEELNRRKAA